MWLVGTILDSTDYRTFFWFQKVLLGWSRKLTFCSLRQQVHTLSPCLKPPPSSSPLCFHSSLRIQNTKASRRTLHSLWRLWKLPGTSLLNVPRLILQTYAHLLPWGKSPAPTRSQRPCDAPNPAPFAESRTLPLHLSLFFCIVHLSHPINHSHQQANSLHLQSLKILPLSLLPSSFLMPIHIKSVYFACGSQAVVLRLAASAWPMNLLEMQITRRHPRPLGPGIWALQALQVILLILWVWEPHYVLYNTYLHFFTLSSLFLPWTPSSLAFVLNSSSGLGADSFHLPTCILSQGDLTHSLLLNLLTFKVIGTTHTFLRVPDSPRSAFYLVSPSECLLTIPVSLKRSWRFPRNFSSPRPCPSLPYVNKWRSFSSPRGRILDPSFLSPPLCILNSSLLSETYWQGSRD